MAKALEISPAGGIGAMQSPEPTDQAIDTNRTSIEPELFFQMVEARAFYKAEQRGFEPGHELEDWLEAEQELLNDPVFLSARPVAPDDNT